MLFFTFSLLTTIYSQTYSIENCETIDSRYSEYCINCNAGYIRNEQFGCVEISDPSSNQRNLIENCQDYNDFNCEKCIEGYNVHEGRCEPICESNCQCFEPNMCIDTHGRKLMCTDYSYNSNCLTCCDYNYELCCSCYSGYGLDNYGGCMPCFDSTCISCYNYYIQCDICTGFYDSYGNCCLANNCKDCSYDVNYCGICSSDYNLRYNSYCCPEHCTTCSYNSECTGCEYGYTFDNGLCIKCESNCISCTYNYCYTCETGYSTDGDGGCESTSARTARVLAMAIAIPIVSFFFLFGLIFGLTWYCRRRAMKLNAKFMKIAPPVPAFNNGNMVIPGQQQYNYGPVSQPAVYNQNYALGATEITVSNFLTLVPNVAIDQNLMYNGINVCKVCAQAFQINGDIRVLPCGHAYHGNCIYNLMIIQNRKTCLHCNRVYA
ncbi:hypothetical protein SteCoe_13480 [Stentor coeruleus]|uniref:RING-type domain-containing protein n=1 Tax=Stentor coeruleus TaxID=5963 RepID=A0A1R2C897_9CILI|nr:hypothetical protein SteCoe_13480 [Stentor coeruleus]